MLVVTRRKGQRIVIGNDIEVVVSGISGSTVRLAVVAPRSVTVLRGEVYEAVLEANRAAAETSLPEQFDAFLEGVVDGAAPSAEAPAEPSSPAELSPRLASSTELPVVEAASAPPSEPEPHSKPGKRTIVSRSAARGVNVSTPEKP